MAPVDSSVPLTLHLYCRIEVAVTDVQAVTAQAVAELRDADIDWSRETDDLDSATAELRSDPVRSLAAVAELGRILDRVEGVEFRGGLVWAEPGPPREPFRPSGG